MSYPYSRNKVQATSGTAAYVKLFGKSKQIIVSCDQDCWIDLAQTAVPGSSFWLPANEVVTIDVTFEDGVSVIQDSAPGTFTVMELGDVVQFNRIRQWFNANASLLGVGSTDYKADASLKRVIAGSASGNSNLKTTVGDTASADSNLLSTISGSITGDSDLVV